MHAIATMMDRLRQAPGELGLVTANGWYLTKHALGVYSTRRPKGRFMEPNENGLNRKIDELAHPTMDPTPSGNATVETFSVMFDRDGQPEHGLVIGSLASGARFVARTRTDRTTLSQMTQEDVIGYSGRVTHGKATNLFEFDL